MKKITVRLQIIALLFISGVLTSCEAPENCDAASTSTCTDSSGSSPSESDSSPSVNNNSSIKTDGYIVEILSDDDGNYFAIGYSGGLEVSKPPKKGLVSYSKLRVSYKTCKLQFWKFLSPTRDEEGEGENFTRTHPVADKVLGG